MQQPQTDTRLSASLGGGVWHQRQRVGLLAEASTFLAADSAAAAQLAGRVTVTPWRHAQVGIDGAWLRARRSNTARMLEVQHTLQWGAVSWQLQAGTSRSARGREDFFGNRLGTSLLVATGPWHVAASAQRARTDDYYLMEASGITLGRVAASYVLDDIGAEVGWRHPRGAVSLVQQWRQGREATIGRTAGGALMGSVPLSSQAQLVLQAGTQLADVLRGIPQARYVGATIRWVPGRRRPSARLRTATSISGPASTLALVTTATEAQFTTAGEVAIVREPGRSALLVVIDAPADAVVELASSITAWTPVRLVRDGAHFVHRLELPTGTHTVAVRINNSAWRAPLGLVSVADDFGGMVGRVTVP